MHQQSAATPATESDHFERPEVPSSPRVVPGQMVRGFTMGMFDVVPGISGGTVALALGIYGKLIAALDRGVDVIGAVLRFDGKRIAAALKSVPWLWILGLLAGILIAVFSLAHLLEEALATYPLPMAGLFLGLIAGACMLCWKQIRRPNAASVGMAAVWAVGFFLFLGLVPSGELFGAEPALWAFFLGGAIAICAMVLPGISGSFLLVLMGLYVPVLSAVTSRDVLTLAVFVAGCAVGISLAARALSWLMSHHHDLVVAAMIGLMVGSVRILWPWPGGLDSVELSLPTADTWLVPTLLALAGFVVVLAVDGIADLVSRRQRAEEERAEESAAVSRSAATD